ncbi:MAG: signal peptidase I, partial [Burkholderiales bacterium]|nr:signal peptidase I [Burkholderiales bacterium]
MSFQSILGNFALILFILTFVTGIIWFLDVFILARKRRVNADKALADFDIRNQKLTS